MEDCGTTYRCQLGQLNDDIELNHLERFECLQKQVVEELLVFIVVPWRSSESQRAKLVDEIICSGRSHLVIVDIVEALDEGFECLLHVRTD